MSYPTNTMISKMLPDSQEWEQTTDEFKHLANSIADNLFDSFPQFTFGIYGDWGSGKSTLMKIIQNHELFKNDDILTIWFNP